MIESLSEVNFLLFAAKHYDNPNCYDTIEFYEDLNRFKYIKRLFNRYEETGELKERLVINHLTVLYNVFGTEAATKMLLLKLDGYHHYLKPFLDLLGTMPTSVTGIGIANKTIASDDIVSNNNVVEILKKI